MKGKVITGGRLSPRATPQATGPKASSGETLFAMLLKTTEFSHSLA